MKRRVVHLSRRQCELWETLREDGTVFLDGVTRRTIDALVDAGLAVEKDSGSLWVTPRGRVAYRLTGNAVAWPVDGSESKGGVEG